MYLHIVDALFFYQDADLRAEVSRREKEEILAKLSQAEKMLVEGKARVNKLEEDNAKLRRAVEQSMTRLNRMSVDSDYLVDRLVLFQFYKKLVMFWYWIYLHSTDQL